MLPSLTTRCMTGARGETFHCHDCGNARPRRLVGACRAATSPRAGRTARARGPGCLIAARCAVSSSCSRTAAAGTPSQARLGAAVGAPADGASATGRLPESGRRCTGRSSTASARWERSTGRASALIALACEQKRGDAVGLNPTDRGKPGTKHHLAVDRRGLPLTAGFTGAERPDATVFAAVIASIPAVRGSRG